MYDPNAAIALIACTSRVTDVARPEHLMRHELTLLRPRRRRFRGRRA